MRRVFAAAFVLAAIGLFVLGASERVEAGGTHIVQQGETLYRIALRYGITVGALAAYNGLSDPTRIHPGQVLRIPTTGTRGPGNQATKPPKSATKQTAQLAAQGALVTKKVTYRYVVSRGPGFFFPMPAVVGPETGVVVTAASEGWVGGQLPGGDSGWVRPEDLREAPITRPREKNPPAPGDMVGRGAMQYLGVRYVWGG